MNHVDQRVDAFVEAVNASYREPKPPTELPEAVRTFEIDGFFAWEIRALESAPWVAEVESRLGCSVPPFYRSLVTRYQLPSFDLGMIRLHANTAEGAPQEWRHTVLADDDLQRLLLANQLVEIGRPVDGHPDPICFNGRDSTGEGEHALVRLDRAATLETGNPVFRPLATSFYQVVASLLA